MTEHPQVIHMPDKCPISRADQCARSAAPQIFGGSPGSGFGSSSSRSLAGIGGGRNTVSRFFVLPFPFSPCANGVQHSEQISYSLPSISFWRQSFVSPQRSQIIMDPPPETRGNFSLFIPASIRTTCSHPHSTLHARIDARMAPRGARISTHSP